MGNFDEMLGDAKQVDTELEEIKQADTKPEDKPAETEKTDTGTETATADTETETGQSETNTELEWLKRHGLDKKYRTVDEALAANIHQNKYIEDLRASQNRMTDILERAIEKRTVKEDPPEPTLTPEQQYEEFARDPQGFIAAQAEKLGFVRKADIQPIQSRVDNLGATIRNTKNAQIVEQFPELRNVVSRIAEGDIPEDGEDQAWDAIQRYARTTKSGQRVSRSLAAGVISLGEAIDEIYPKVFGDNGNGNGKPTTPIVVPLTPEQKAAAKTSSGGSKEKTKKSLNDYTEADFDKLPIETQEQLLIEAGVMDSSLATKYRKK